MYYCFVFFFSSRCLKDNAANEILPWTTHAHSQRGNSRGENESICYIKGTIAFVNSFKLHIELHWSRGWLRNVRNPILKGNQVPFSQDLSLHIWVWWNVFFLFVCLFVFNTYLIKLYFFFYSHLYNLLQNHRRLQLVLNHFWSANM